MVGGAVTSHLYDLLIWESERIRLQNAYILVVSCNQQDVKIGFRICIVSYNSPTCYIESSTRIQKLTLLILLGSHEPIFPGIKFCTTLRTVLV